MRAKSHSPHSTLSMSPKTKLRAATVGGTADEVEAAFYEALQHGDIDALMACWSDDDETFCVHPGGPRLVGPTAIRAAFEQMFGNGAIHATPARVRKVETLASSVHNVLERIEVLTAEGPRHAFVLATNVYHKSAQGWRMVAHHASPGTAREPFESDEPASQTLH
jgi:ketosteroid isomerase-like protein